MASDYFELIRFALPLDMDADELFSLVPGKMWKADEHAAAALALASCKRLNWDAYVRAHPEAAAGNGDVCAYFLERGIYEGHKLFCHSLPRAEEAAAKVSVIVVNYNNDVFLDNCIRSVTAQTLEAIEIIVVDDGSTDNSIEIIRQWEARDWRVKAVRHEANLGTLMARKNGARHASGQSIMYVDADDYLAPNACEMAYNCLMDGYDIVNFNVQVLPHGYVDPQRLLAVQKRYDASTPREYAGQEIIDALFVRRDLLWQMFRKIYATDLIKAALEDIADAYMIYGEDAYMLLAIARRAHRMLSIKDKLYIYRFGTGISTRTTEDMATHVTMHIGSALNAIVAYASRYQLDIQVNRIRIEHCQQAITHWLLLRQRQDIAECYARFIEQFGFSFLIHVFASQFEARIGAVARQLAAMQDCTPVGDSRPIGNIGLVVDASEPERTACIVERLAPILMRLGYKLTLLNGVPASRSFGAQLPGLREVFLPAGEDALGGRLIEFAKVVEEGQLDLVISLVNYSCELLWQMMICRHYGTAFAIFFHHDVALNLNAGVGQVRMKDMKAIYACADMLLHEEEICDIYWHARGVNSAAILPHPCWDDCASSGAGITDTGSRCDSRWPPAHAVVACLSTAEELRPQLDELLETLELLSQDIPDWVCFLTSDTCSPQEPGVLRAALAGHSLHGRIQLAGCIAEIPLCSHAVLLMLGHGIVSHRHLRCAMERGMPCVVCQGSTHWEVPNIVQVQPRAVAVAQSIAHLLLEGSWHSPNTHTNWARDLGECLGNMLVSSPWQAPEARQYDLMLRHLSHCAGAINKS